MEFLRQEYWSGLPFPSPGDLPDPGIEPGSPALQVKPPEKPVSIVVPANYFLRCAWSADDPIEGILHVCHCMFYF